MCSSNGASASGSDWIGDTVWPVRASCSTRWRWENVPRSASWPVSRIGTPSVSSDAKASDSACAQSIPPSVPIDSRRRSSCLTSLGWTVKPSGTRSSSSLSSCRRSAGTAVRTSGDGERSSVYSPVGCSTEPASSAALIAALSSACRRVSSSQIAWLPSSTSCWGMTFCATSWAANSSETRFLLLIFAYISGCVYAGSSASLWPKRR